MKPFASRMNDFGESATIRMAQRASQLAAAGHDIIALTTGEPDFPTAEHIKAAAIEALHNGHTKYTSVGGTLELKKAVLEKFHRDNGLDFGVDEIIASAGAKQVVFHALMATVETGHEVIIPSPCWVSYLDITRLFGGRPVAIDCDISKSFKLQARQLDEAITTDTRWFIFNSPCNPSGTVYSREEIREITDVLVRHPHVWLLTDDIYETIVYDDSKFVTPLQVEPRLRERTLTVNGVSKAYAMTGWRLGYGAGPSSLIREMTRLQSQSITSPSSISQAAARAALLGDQSHVLDRTIEFERRRDYVVREINTTPGLTCLIPQGAFYVFINCKNALGKVTLLGKRISSDEDLAEYFLEEAGVALVHGAAFGMSPYLRLSFAAPIGILHDACARLRKACSRLSD